MRGGWAGSARVVQVLTAAGLLGLALLVVVLVGQGVAAAHLRVDDQDRDA